jgi:hypothetical protein
MARRRARPRAAVQDETRKNKRLIVTHCRLFFPCLVLHRRLRRRRASCSRSRAEFSSV